MHFKIISTSPIPPIHTEIIVHTDTKKSPRVIHTKNLFFRLPSLFSYVIILRNSFEPQKSQSRNVNGLDPVNNQGLLISGMSLSILQGVLMIYNNSKQPIDSHYNKFFKKLNYCIGLESILSCGLNIYNSYEKNDQLDLFLIGLSFQLLSIWEISIMNDTLHHLKNISKEKKPNLTRLQYLTYIPSQLLICSVVFLSLSTDIKQNFLMCYSLLSMTSLMFLTLSKLDLSKKATQTTKPEQVHATESPNTIQDIDFFEFNPI